MGALQKELANTEAELQRATRLLKLADPDGYFKEGSHAARKAKEQGVVREEQRRAAAAAKRAEQLVRGLWQAQHEPSARDAEQDVAMRVC